MTKYTCIDSFCGAGGLGLGLQRAGFEILLSFDIDKLCIDTINKNKKYFDHPAEVADIADMLNGELLKRCNLKRGELFLLAGGPPCQGFSVQRRGSDTDARNGLVLMYGKLIDELYPKYFVMENVSGIAGKRGKTILQQLIEDVEQLGYHVHVQLLDAQDFGVPQRRRRFFVVHNRKSVPKDLHDTDVVIYGHSHKYAEQMVDGVLWLNPGSCGKRRFDQEITFAIMTVDGSETAIEKITIPHT